MLVDVIPCIYTYMQDLEISTDDVKGIVFPDGTREYTVECECSISRKRKLLDKLQQSGTINPVIQDKGSSSIIVG